jgi:hypothetical protein
MSNLNYTFNNYNTFYYKYKECCNIKGLGPVGKIGNIGSQGRIGQPGYIGPTGNTSAFPFIIDRFGPPVSISSGGYNINIYGQLNVVNGYLQFPDGTIQTVSFPGKNILTFYTPKVPNPIYDIPGNLTFDNNYLYLYVNTTIGWLKTSSSLSGNL